jgi:hypothetical protein
VSCSARWTKAEPFIKLGRRGTLRPQSESVEPASGGFNDLRDQAPPHSEPSKREEDVKVPHPTDTLLCRIRVNVEPTNTDPLPAGPSAEQRFAGPVKLDISAAPGLTSGDAMYLEEEGW